MRFHLGIASLALIYTEMYIIATDVFKKAPQKSIMEDRPLVSEILRLNSASQVGGPKRTINY